jgi:hypothetical protein
MLKIIKRANNKCEPIAHPTSNKHPSFRNRTYLQTPGDHFNSKKETRAFIFNLKFLRPPFLHEVAEEKNKKKTDLLKQGKIQGSNTGFEWV